MRHATMAALGQGALMNLKNANEMPVFDGGSVEMSGSAQC